jgi:PDZ domain-containing secreted protein
MSVAAMKKTNPYKLRIIKLVFIAIQLEAMLCNTPYFIQEPGTSFDPEDGT